MDLATLKLKFRDRLDEMALLVERTNKSSVLIVQQFPHDKDKDILLPRVRESISNIIAFVELGNAETLHYVLDQCDGVVDVIAIDADIKCAASAALVSIAKSQAKQSRLFFYSDTTTWAESAINFIQNIEDGLLDKNILVGGKGLLCNKLIRGMCDFGARVFWYNPSWGPEASESDAPLQYRNAVDAIGDDFDFAGMDIIIGAAIKEESIPQQIIANCKEELNAYDIGIGNFSLKAIAALENRNCKVYRLDNRAGISSTVLGLLETEYLIKEMMGSIIIKGVELVAAGVMGHRGAIIVDSIRDPSYIVGIANGKGRLNLVPQTPDEENSIRFVEKLIAKP